MLKLQNVSLTLKGTKIFTSLNLEIYRGDKVWIRGRSGSGKTSLFRLFLGFVQPDDGAVYIDQNELNGKSVWKLRRQMAYVSQDPDIYEGTVQQFINGIYALKVNREQPGEQLMEVLHYFELSGSYLDKDFRELSGGEKQRIALTAAILLDREIYLLDEPTASLDMETKTKVLDYFAKWEGKTVILSTHDEQIPGIEQYNPVELKPESDGSN